MILGRFCISADFTINRQQTKWILGEQNGICEPKWGCLATLSMAATAVPMVVATEENTTVIIRKIAASLYSLVSPIDMNAASGHIVEEGTIRAWPKFPLTKASFI